MRPAPPQGDLALTARPASADTFAPFGRLLGVGDRARLGAGGPVLATLDAARPGPRRYARAQRYPEARRLLLPLGDLSLLVLVLGPGDPPAGPPAAFTTAPGQGILLDPGVWHAGPAALTEGVLLEVIETSGPVDRLDRRLMSGLAGVEAIRVQLPEEPGAAGPDLDLESPGAVLVEEGVVGRLSLAMLLLDDLDVAPESPALDQELEHAAEALRSLGGAGDGIGGRFGVDEARRLWRDLKLDPAANPPPYEVLVREALRGGALGGMDALTAAAHLVALRRQRSVTVYDASPVTGPLQLRLGREHETLEDDRNRSVGVSGLPVLCDQEGPFAGPVGRARRVRVGTGVQRALLVFLLLAGTDEGDALAHLMEASKVVREHCGGREAGRLIL